MKEKLNIGVIGQGGRGFGLLKEIILPREDINVLAVCDLYEDRREASAKAVRQRATIPSARRIITKCWP